jgi:aspartyl-tRNA synthetase
VRAISPEDHLAFLRAQRSASFLQTPAWGRVKSDWRHESLGWYDGEKLVGEYMAEKGFPLYFICEYPEEEKPFYIMEKDGTSYSFSFDLDYKGQEISSGGQREHRYDRLVARMEKKGLNPEDFSFYLDAFRYGMPPHGGWGIGIERLLVKMLDLGNIREAILFPRDPARLTP